LTRRAGGAHADVAYFCKLPDAPLDAMLVEIPKWMLDAAHCAPMRLVDDPHVDCATLRTLKSAIRYRAAQLAELFSIHARIVELTDAQSQEWQLIDLSVVGNRFLRVHTARHIVYI
jgi:hypothetical protein